MEMKQDFLRENIRRVRELSAVKKEQGAVESTLFDKKLALIERLLSEKADILKESFPEEYQEITELNKQVEEKEKEFRLLLGYVQCDACGKEIKKDFSFCPHCGEKLPNPLLCHGFDVITIHITESKSSE